MNVNIYIETSYKGPAVRRAAGAWLVEYISSTGKPVTRGGILYSGRTTENSLALHLIGEAFSRLTKPCGVEVYTGCGHVLRTMQNHWLAQWRKNGWVNAKGKPVRDAEEWERCALLMEHHICGWTDGCHAYRQEMQYRIGMELKRRHGDTEGYEEIDVPGWNTPAYRTGRREEDV
ncbi:MAG: hypothetical protein NC489_25525 [Ruminococcus flavefaciens]|nr:hypothetical protein [Ruminococcus flavefaciens]